MVGIVVHIRGDHTVRGLLRQVAVVVIRECPGGEAIRDLRHRVRVRVTGARVGVGVIFQAREC